MWCNGNTSDFGSGIPRSNRGKATKHVSLTFCHYGSIRCEMHCTQTSHLGEIGKRATLKMWSPLGLPVRFRQMAQRNGKNGKRPTGGSLAVRVQNLRANVTAIPTLYGPGKPSPSVGDTTVGTNEPGRSGRPIN